MDTYTEAVGMAIDVMASPSHGKQLEPAQEQANGIGGAATNGINGTAHGANGHAHRTTPDTAAAASPPTAATPAATSASLSSESPEDCAAVSRPSRSKPGLPSSATTSSSPFPSAPSSSAASSALSSSLARAESLHISSPDPTSGFAAAASAAFTSPPPPLSVPEGDFERFATLAKKYVKFTMRTTGRDKIYRTLQYASRFLSHYALTKLGAKLIAERLKNLERGLSSGRKLMRLGKTLDYLLTTQKALLERDSLLRILSVATEVNRAGRMLFDMLMWAYQVGVLKGDRTSIGKLGSWCWLLGIATSFGKNAYVLGQLLEDEKRLRQRREKDAAEEVRARQYAVVMDLCKDVFDCPIPMLGLKLLPASSEGLVGGSGAISSAIGLYQSWTKMFSESAVTARSLKDD
eukprot:m.171655 g.171655  ORF g.171655 m.171655 type:complete len:406 (+) comp17845_c0_seq2:100-1317(+)